MFSINGLMSLVCMAAAGAIVFVAPSISEEVSGDLAFHGSDSKASPRVAGGTEATVVLARPIVKRNPLYVWTGGGQTDEYDAELAMSRWHQIREDAMAVNRETAAPKQTRPSVRRAPVRRASSGSSPRPSRRVSAGDGFIFQTRAYQEKLERDRERLPRNLANRNTRISRALNRFDQGDPDNRASLFEQSRYYRDNGSAYYRMEHRVDQRYRRNNVVIQRTR